MNIQAILSVPDERLRSDFLAELNSLIEQASVPKIADTSIYYCMAYDLLVQLADRMPSVSSSLREGMILPPVAFVPAEVDVLSLYLFLFYFFPFLFHLFLFISIYSYDNRTTRFAR